MVVGNHKPDQYYEDLTLVTTVLTEDQEFCDATLVEPEYDPSLSGRGTSSLEASPLVGVHASPLSRNLVLSQSKHLAQILIDSLTKYGSHAFSLQFPEPGLLRRIGERLHSSLSARLLFDFSHLRSELQSNQFLFLLPLPVSSDRQLLPVSSYIAVMCCSEGVISEITRILVPSLSEFTYISLVKDLECALLRSLDCLVPPVSVFVPTELLAGQRRFSVELFHLVTLSTPKYAKVLTRLSSSDRDKLLLWCSSPQDCILSGHPLVVPLRNRAQYFSRKFNRRFDSQALAMLELCAAFTINSPRIGSADLL